MAEQLFDRINDYGSVRITLASPNDIRSWSFGEVKKPETINYRTYRPEKDGLFCERIFGPERDYECACGKYKGTKFKGIICDRCGVKVTHSRVRRKRMGHINLAAPIVHIWFFKATPSRLGNLMGMKTTDLEKVIYFQDYVVVDPGDTPLQVQQMLTEDEYRQATTEYGGAFKAMMGAEAMKELLLRLDLDELATQLRDGLAATRSKQKIKDLSKRLKIVEQIRSSENQPEWMVMDVTPVIPPDLRPLVLLESGNFATSDLNDLYRRIINRNNRLKKLMDLNAPEVIIRNEKRMLQQSVDALFDNGRCRRPVLGSSNRPLKSLTDMIKGKQGRFRENLLGKRVDYSARSVIVVGPELQLNQCGLPKKIALELYQPFIIRKLKEHGLADTIKSAKKILERRDAEVWDILEEVIYQHPVMLNRAPTLHRMGIQAFEPVLVEGNAIRVHPLVCTGFNADFDGDQMAVHLPLSVEAQAETHVLMLSPHNIFSPANGNPIISPSQDIVLGVYYITAMATMPDKAIMQALTGGEAMGDADLAELRTVNTFKDPTEALLAYDLKEIAVHDPIVVRLPKDRFSGIVEDQSDQPTALPQNRRIVTSVGRLLFNDILDDGMPYYNCALGKKGGSRVIDDTYARMGRPATITLLDRLKEIGFKRSTTAGLSFGITDLRIPARKEEVIETTQKKVDRVDKAYQAGAITERERYNQLLDLWTHCREEVTTELLKELQNDRRDEQGNPVPIDSAEGRPYLNPVWLMSDSGSRGNVSQIQQLAGMRGLISKPSGELIDTPIRANAREGMSVLEYFTSTHGARKGLADTALKTADSGYLTRKLADVAQNCFVTEEDCNTRQGITKRAIYKGEEIDVPLREAIIGRTARETIRNPITDSLIVDENAMITEAAAREIESLGIDSVMVRSPLTCESAQGICQRCYCQDMSTGRLVEQGLAVGIIAAQSIGEPGTQLTMRTFHTGGIGHRTLVETDYRAQNAGTIQLKDANEVSTVDDDGNETLVALKRNGELSVHDDKGRELEKYKVQYGAYIRVTTGDKVRKGQALVQWDPHRTPILAEKQGVVRFQDVLLGETVRPEKEAGGPQKAKQTDKDAGEALVVIEHKGELHPQIIIEDMTGKILDFHYLPAKARIEVQEGQQISAGHMLARQPREVVGSSDIVGGLPRVTEIFEARKPKDAAVMAEISGAVELRSDKRRGKMTIIVRSEAGLEMEHHVPQDRHLLVHTGDYVTAGDPLIDGPLVPHDILRVKGDEALFTYLLDEVQNVYRAQGVPINDKHVEIILAQMLGKLRVENPGDSALLPNEVIDRHRFRQLNDKLGKMAKIKEPGGTTMPVNALVPRNEIKEANARAESEGLEPAKGTRARPATAMTLLLGITKASLQSESFLSGASFQETTKVLTEAALAARSDTLVGLKENVLLGHLIPAGTGFKAYTRIQVEKLAEPPSTETPSREENILAAAEKAEAAGAQTPAEIETTVGESSLVAQLLGEADPAFSTPAPMPQPVVPAPIRVPNIDEQ
ncbi:MAG: DNA-directed RNA polymerase subunit beta' [Phycisphaeraceae bacterium]|nr:DNA-directed RNA polymerase subunit beta' [Phycisphaeraceae bacterium]